MLDLPDKFVLLDLECTTWEGAMERCWSGPGEHREVVQIGAILVRELVEMWHFNVIVRPRINPQLSGFFIELTGISQEYVDHHSCDFAEALGYLRTLCSDRHIYSFDTRIDGSRLFDRDVLIENCELYGLEFPFEEGCFHNIYHIFHKHGYAPRQSGAAPELFGIKPPKSHNALNDVRGLLIALNALNARLAG